MPALSRWCVRCALCYLVAGMGIGSWLLIEQANGHDPGTTWPVLHAHLLLVGFLLLLVMGVAYWMFPRVQGARPGRGGGWVAFALVNAGLILRVVAQPRVDAHGGQPWRFLLEAAAILPTVGITVFALSILPRIRAAMTPAKARALRERAGG
jgi:heme/copper-type cytochrome/quinol oxidase subunit 1